MNKSVLIVDPNSSRRNELREVLSPDYNVFEAEGKLDAEKLIMSCENEFSALIISILEGSDGLDLLQFMESDGLYKDSPVLVMNTDGRDSLSKKCFDLGVFDIVLYPLHPIIVRHRVNAATEIFDSRRKLKRILEQTTAELEKQDRYISDTNKNIIEFLTDIIEARNLESGEHLRRVKAFSYLMCEVVAERYPKYNLTEEEISYIASASAMHDIGKIMIPDNILLKPQRLTDSEYEIMKTHTTKGSELLESARSIMGDKCTDICKEIALYHHERYDGGGYPFGLKGDDIPISAQIVSIADVFDALVAQRVYRASLEKDEAYKMIMEGRCGAFSPDILECFSIRFLKMKKEAVK